MFGGHTISLVVEKYGKANISIIMWGNAFSRKNILPIISPLCSDWNTNLYEFDVEFIKMSNFSLAHFSDQWYYQTPEYYS